MKKYLLKRILYIFLVFIVLSFLMYVIYNAIPFDRARTLADAQKASFKTDPQGYVKLYENYRINLGLDKGIVRRYLMWLGVMPYEKISLVTGERYTVYSGMLQGDFGVSYQNVQQPVMKIIPAPMKNTLLLNIFSVVIALAITIPLGIFCAVKSGSKRDVAIRVGSIIGYSMPTFITAILFIYLFAIALPIFPVVGQKTPGSNYTGLQEFADRMYYMALPLIVMTFGSLGGMTRYVRASMLDALSMDCIRTARAKGLKEKVVVYSHAWRNALIPIVTLVVGWFFGIFTGSIMIENIFGLNGMGKLYITSLQTNDFDVVLTLQMFYVFVGLLGNLITDILYGFIDPRIRVSA